MSNHQHTYVHMKQNENEQKRTLSSINFIINSFNSGMNYLISCLFNYNLQNTDAKKEIIVYLLIMMVKT